MPARMPRKPRGTTEKNCALKILGRTLAGPGAQGPAVLHGVGLSQSKENRSVGCLVFSFLLLIFCFGRAPNIGELFSFQIRAGRSVRSF